ncbi:MAG: hypothetical protein ACLFPQ_04440 [Candidatus Woesearchaeota archaeon]
MESFEGKYPIFFTLFVLGLFIPPLLAISCVYFLAKIYDKKPKVFDEKLISYFIIQTGHLLIIGFLARLRYPGNIYTIPNILRVGILGSIIATIFIYPFVYTWINYDYLKYKKRIRGLRDTRIGKFFRKHIDEIEQKREEKKNKNRIKTRPASYKKKTKK